MPSSSSGDTVRYPNCSLLFWKGLGPGRPARSHCSYSCQRGPSSSYFFRFSGSPGTLLASLTSLNRSSEALSPGVMLARQLPECAADLLVGGRPRNAENRVVVLEGRWHLDRRYPWRGGRETR